MTKRKELSFRGCLTAFLCIAVTGCGGATSHVLTPDEGTEVVWHPSYVVIIGRDAQSPKSLLEGCKRRGSVIVRVGNVKISYHNEFRAAAQRLGGNAVADVSNVSPLRYQGTIYSCPFFLDVESRETGFDAETSEQEETTTKNTSLVTE